MSGVIHYAEDALNKAGINAQDTSTNIQETQMKFKDSFTVEETKATAQYITPDITLDTNLNS